MTISSKTAFKIHSLNPVCSCVKDIETSVRFFLYHSYYSNEKTTFLNIARNIDRNFLTKISLKVTETEAATEGVL